MHDDHNRLRWSLSLPGTAEGGAMKTWTTMTIAAVLAVSAPAEAGAPLDRVQSAVAAILEIATRADLQGQPNLVTRRMLLRDVADEFFDLPEMARRVLGLHWSAITDAERAEFLAAFTDLLERCYVTSIENYAGEQVVYVGETVEADHATVRSKIVTTRGAEITIDYRLRRSSGRWTAFDVLLENISLVSNYREQVNRILRATSFAALLARMRSGQLTAVIIPRGAAKLK
jgi:phospholipid transport system substrate-binding protein